MIEQAQNYRLVTAEGSPVYFDMAEGRYTLTPNQDTRRADTNHVTGNPYRSRHAAELMLGVRVELVAAGLVDVIR